MSNTTYTYLARDLTAKRRQQLDEFEELEVEVVPVHEVIRKMGTAPYDNAIMMSALAYYLRWKAEQRDDPSAPEATP